MQYLVVKLFLFSLFFFRFPLSAVVTVLYTYYRKNTQNNLHSQKNEVKKRKSKQDEQKICKQIAAHVGKPRKPAKGETIEKRKRHRHRLLPPAQLPVCREISQF